MKIQRLKNLIIILFSACIFFSVMCDFGIYAVEKESSYGNIVKMADMSIITTAEGISFSAGIYSDADRTNALLPLTATGTTLSGWQYNTDIYLGVTVSGLPMSGETQYQLVIEMAPILYLNQNSDPMLANTTVSFEKHEPLTVNTDYTYELKKYSLKKLTYNIVGGTESLTLGLPFRFDNALWNKTDGANLGDGTNPLIRVYLKKNGEISPITDCNVKLAQATVSGSVENSPSIGLYSSNSTFATSVMGVDESLRLNVSRSSNTTYTGGYYYGDLTVKLTLPICTIAGTQHVMDYKDIRFLTSGGTSEFSQTEENGAVTLKAKNFFLNAGGIFETWFYAPESVKSISGIHKFTGKVSVIADGMTIISEKNFTVTVDNNKDPILKSVSTAGDANVLETDTVQFLGRMALRNEAAFANGSGNMEVKLSFDIHNTFNVGVTSIVLMCDRDTEVIHIHYTLIDRDGKIYSDTSGISEFYMTVQNKNYAPDSTSTDNLYQLFTRNDLPAEHQGYFFKTVSYTIGNLDGNTKAYHSGADKAPYSAGTVWGYVMTDTIPSELPYHTMEVYKIAEDNRKTILNGLTVTVKVKLDSGTSVAYGMDSASVSATTVEAGDPIAIKGSVFVTSYPYTSNNCLNDIRIGIILPEGVEVNKSSVLATYANGALNLDLEEIEIQEIDSGKNFWILKFKSGQKIGYYNEKLDAIESGAKLNFSLQLNTDKTMSTQTIVLREAVFVAGENRANGAGGSYAHNAWKDTYDLNGNGSTEDNIGCFSLKTTQSITIQAAPALLEITDRLHKQNEISGQSVTIDNFADIINYEFDIRCSQGGSASGFYYFVPIAQDGFKNEEFFLEANPVYLELKDAVTVNNINGTKMKVYYTTKTVSDYNAALNVNVTEWHEILPDSATWKDVTMLKIVAEEETIVNGSVNTISIPLGYSGDELEYEHYAGMQIKWKSRGYYSYKLGANSTSATRSTDGVTVTLTYTPEIPIIFTLTAAKDRIPQGENAINIYSFELPEFILAQKYSIKDIKPTNITLVDSAYDFSTADSVASNTNFRISVRVADDKSEKDPVDIQKDGTIVGSLEAQKAPKFTFELYNANALSDIVTERYVKLTLIGDNGVIVPVTIYIKCEMAAADATKSAIVAGKQYSPFDGGISISVSQDSAFTAQFVTENFIPQNYSEHTLIFGNAPVKGTVITMIDWTYDTALKYYYFVMDGSTASVSLQLFKGMGGGADYAESDSTEPVTERLLFIVQFPDSGEIIRDNTLTLTKKLAVSTGEESQPEVLKFASVNKRIFSLSTDKNEVYTEENVLLTYTSVCSVTDSRYTSRNLSIVIGAANNTVIPVDARLIVGDNVYYLNSQGEFIIPLEAIQLGGGSKSMSFVSAAETDVDLSIKLYASATSNAEKPMKGTAVAGPVTISVKTGISPSFKVESMSLRLLHTKDLTKNIIMQTVKRNAETVTVEIQKKDAAGYATQSNILEAVNGITNHTQGIFDISDVTDGVLSMKFNENTPAGTYRVLFTVSNENYTIEVPYNFIVSEQ